MRFHTCCFACKVPKGSSGRQEHILKGCCFPLHKETATFSNLLALALVMTLWKRILCDLWKF
jgi:hypothetical protein